jgi:hypothetical protein
MKCIAQITKNIPLSSEQVFEGNPDDVRDVFMFALEHINRAPVSWVDIFIRQEAPKFYTFRLKSDRSILFTMELEEDPT